MKVIPIGSWCRTAFQVKDFLEYYSGEKNLAYPFDWTITPHSALVKVFSSNFDVEKVLTNREVVVSKFGSIEDCYSNLIFHHDLEDKVVEKFDLLKAIEGDFFSSIDVVKNTVGRFSYSFNNLLKLRNEEDILFIRWQREGHPDLGLPSAFENESLKGLANVLESFLGHKSFKTLIVSTRYVSSEYSGQLFSLNKYENGYEGIVYERRGYDGDGSQNFRGDTRAWRALIEATITEFLGK